MTTRAEGIVPCPICKTVPDQETGRCHCRPSPGNWTPNASLASDAQVTHAESLFDKYLAARLVRSRRALTVAKVALLRDPRNRPKLEALRAAEAETEKLHTQVVAQTRKAAAAAERASTPTAGEAPSTKATSDFRMIQAAKAEAAYQPAGTSGGRISRPDDRECPRCDERLPGDVTECACGHQFPTASDAKVIAERLLADEPFLTEEEIAALRGKPLRRAE